MARGVAPDSDERSTVVDVDIVVDDEVKVRMRKALVPARVQPWLQASVALPVLSLTPRDAWHFGKGFPRPWCGPVSRL